MNIECGRCQWDGMCGQPCPVDCQDYTPVDDLESCAAYYSRIIAENIMEYASVGKEFSDVPTEG